MQKNTQPARHRNPGRHHVGTPGNIISECPGDLVGIRILEDDGIGLETDHLAGPLVDDVLQSTTDFVFSLGKWHHLGVEIQAAIAIVEVQSLQDLAVRLDANTIALLQVEQRFRGLGALGNAVGPHRVWRAADSTLELVIDPAYGRADPRAGRRLLRARSKHPAGKRKNSKAKPSNSDACFTKLTQLKIKPDAPESPLDQDAAVSITWRPTINPRHSIPGRNT
jgi:hypothetical protein